MIYHETVRPRLSDFGRTGRMTCEAVLQILETAGSHHSDSAGDPLLRDTEEGAVWILTDWRARFLKPVISGEPFQVDTWMYKRSTAGITLRGYILTDEAGNVTGVTLIRMELGEPDASGRRSPVEIPGSEYTVDCDMVIMALGTSPNPLISSTTKGLETNRRS